MLTLRISRNGRAIFAIVRDGNDKERFMIARAVPDGIYEGDYLQSTISNLSKNSEMYFVGDGVPTNYWDARGEEHEINEVIQGLFAMGFEFGAVYE